MITERTGQLQEIRKQLTLGEQELSKLKQNKELGEDTEHLRSLLKEKESFIKVQTLLQISYTFKPSLSQILMMVAFTHQELIHKQEEATQPYAKETEAETKALQEELQLVLKREREAQVSIYSSVYLQ